MHPPPPQKKKKKKKKKKNCRCSRPLPIYLDNQATTPLDPRVLDAMMPYFTEHFGNPPSSGSHVYGKNAMTRAIEAARADVAALIGAEPREIVFTSGATEANNMAVKGAAHFRTTGASRATASPNTNACWRAPSGSAEGFAVIVCRSAARSGGAHRLAAAITNARRWSPSWRRTTRSA